MKFEKVPSKHAEHTRQELMRTLSNEHTRQELMRTLSIRLWN